MALATTAANNEQLKRLQAQITKLKLQNNQLTHEKALSIVRVCINDSVQAAHVTAIKLLWDLPGADAAAHEQSLTVLEDDFAVQRTELQTAVDEAVRGLASYPAALTGCGAGKQQVVGGERQAGHDSAHSRGNQRCVLWNRPFYSRHAGVGMEPALSPAPTQMVAREVMLPPC